MGTMRFSRLPVESRRCCQPGRGLRMCLTQSLGGSYPGCKYFPQILTFTLVAQMVKKLSAMRETRVWSLGREDPLEEGMATHSRILAWRIPMDRAWRATVHGVTKHQTQLGEESTRIQLSKSLSPWTHISVYSQGDLWTWTGWPLLAVQPRISGWKLVWFLLFIWFPLSFVAWLQHHKNHCSIGLPSF